MLDVLSLMTRVLLSPLWGLWWVYRFLWWTFSPDAPPPTRQAQGDKAFDIVDSRPAPAPLPMGALRGGFIGSLAASGGLAVLASTAARNAIVQPATAAATWAWTSVLIFVLSIFAVRSVVLRRNARTRARLGEKALGAVKAAKVAAVALALKGDDETKPSRLRRAMGVCARAGRTGWSWTKAGCAQTAKVCGRAPEACRNAAAGAQRLARTLQNPVHAAPATDAGPRG